MGIKLGVEIIARIVGDGNLKSIKTASRRRRYSHGRRKAPIFDARCDKRKAIVKPELRVYWFLASFYKSRQRRTKSATKYLEYAALVTAAKMMWEMVFQELCQKIKIKEKSREEIILTEDWRVCVRTALD